MLSFKSIYGDLLTLDTSYSEKPTINGQTVNYQPDQVFPRPFIISDYKSGVVTVREGGKKIVYDFNSLL